MVYNGVKRAPKKRVNQPVFFLIYKSFSEIFNPFLNMGNIKSFTGFAII
jgi:hypothetical protein